MTLEDMFKVKELTDSINKLPIQPGLIGSMGLFAEKGVRTTSVFIEVRNGRLVLVPDQSRSADPQSLANSKRDGFPLKTSHLPLGGVILPDEIQDVRGFGGEGTVDNLKAQAQVINDKLSDLKASIDATVEWHRVGAIRGQILDADGSVIHDLFDAFGVAKKSINTNLKSAATDVRKVCLDAKRHAEKRLGGVVVTGFRAVCGADFFDALTNHEQVKAAFANWQAAQDRLSGDMRSGFTYGGIEFVEYNLQVGGKEFIPANIAQVFPVAKGVFSTYFAPANYNEAVNTIGLPYYAKSEPRKMGKGWDLEAQSNPLALCHFPEALVELKL
jgi:hypothetical protein